MATDLVISPFTDDLSEPGGQRFGRPRVDLAAYADRIGLSAPLAPTLATLQALHLAHATSVPFENVDVLLGRPIALDLSDLERKLVRERRGGYCFEQNTLFAAVLEDIGFGVTGLAARVRSRPPGQGMLGRTHMALRVVPADADGVAYLADVGYGNGGLLGPIPIEPGPPVEQRGRLYQLTAGTLERVLTLTENGVRRELYGITTEPFFVADYLIVNHHTSTSPESIFTRELVAQRQRLDGRVSLRGRTLTEERAGVTSTRDIAHAADLGATLVDAFGIVLSAADVSRLWSRLDEPPAS